MYDLSDGRARNPLIATIIFTVVGTVSTVLRIQARRMLRLGLHADDYLILAAVFFEYVEVAIQFASILVGGVGRHVEDIDPADVVKTMKLNIPFQALYGVTVCLTKASIIFFYMRIFGTKRAFRISSMCVLIFIILWAINVILEAFLLCRPLAFNWDPNIKGVCGDRHATYVSAGALNVITDFMVMVLPIPHILKLQLAFKRKMGLIVMFSLGLFITVVSILRIKSLEAISFTDITYTLPTALFWTTLEPWLGIINANLPMIRTCLISISPRLFGSTSVQTNKRSGNTTYTGRPNNFQLLGEDGLADVKLGRIGIENIIRGGRTGRNALSVYPDADTGSGSGSLSGGDGDSESQRHLKSGAAITVSKTVVIEHS